jgi:hypothetical protein
MSERVSSESGWRRRLPRVEQLLPLACLAAAALLLASEFMTTFEFTPPGREAVDEQTSADRHGYALAIIAGFAFVATLVAVLAASKPAAISVGVAGVLALLVFVIIDLPDVGAVGTLDDGRQSFFDAEAVPQVGFWLVLIGALALAVSGIALATLSVEQLAALRPRRSPDRESGADATPAAGPVVPSEAPAARGAPAETDESPSEAPRHRASARPR